MNMSTRIYHWYRTNFPTDEEGIYIHPDVTFRGLLNTLYAHEDVYSYLGDVDSVIRERCFARLAKLIGKPYEFIYNLWIRG